MISRIRIDDRLLHGQVAYSWKSAIGYEAIVIANDDAATNSIRKSALKMAKPDGVKIAIREVNEAIELLENDLLKKLNVFVICSNPKDAYEVYRQIEETPVITVGGMQKENDKELFSPAVYVNDEDLSYLDQLSELGADIEIKQVPDEKDKNYNDLRKNN